MDPQTGAYEVSVWGFPFMVKDLLKEAVKSSTGSRFTPAALVFSVMTAGAERASVTHSYFHCAVMFALLMSGYTVYSVMNV